MKIKVLHLDNVDLCGQQSYTPYKLPTILAHSVQKSGSVLEITGHSRAKHKNTEMLSRLYAWAFQHLIPRV